MLNITSKFQKDLSITFLSYLADSQTNKQTKTGKNITSLAEIIMQSADTVVALFVIQSMCQVMLENIKW